MSDVAPRYFRTPADFRAWLETHHADENELLVGFYKKSSGRPSITRSASRPAARAASGAPSTSSAQAS
jgi:uncharacterized protein YdeI (YjbR/CyaY-like superfamily)